MREISLTIVLTLVSFFSKAQQPVTNPAPFVIPALREWQGGTGDFMLTESSRIVIDPSFADSLSSIANIFKRDLEDLTGRKGFIVKRGKPVKGAIYLTLKCGDKGLGNEGYILDIGQRGIRMQAMTYRGLFWGTRTLLQILEQDQAHRSIPCGRTRDYPKYAVRGFVLDAGRKFFSMAFLRQYVRFMAYYKMNDFQIHLSDNGFRKHFGNNWDSTYAAFRLESSTFPGLTAKDGSYSKAEFIELERLAAAYCVNIVPEIDVPAHALAFSHYRKTLGSAKYGMDHLDLNNPATAAFTDSLFREYIAGAHPVFSGPDVHIGTDEYARDASEQFRAFTDHTIALVQSYNKQVRVWGALTHARGNTPVRVKGVTMNIWYNGYADPTEMARLGYDLISTPDGWLYIVPAAGYYNDYLDIKELFNKWEPVMVGDVTFPMGDTQIRGGSFAVWNDVVGNGITEKDVHDRVFPAMQVLSQKMWSGGGNGMDFDQFATLAAHIGEGPESNMRARLNGVDSITLLAGTLRLNGGNDAHATSIHEVGYDYTVFFRVRPDSMNPPNAVLFRYGNATIRLNQQYTGNLGFSREGYDFSFEYKLPANSWTSIAITGNHTGTSLFVNGTLVQRLTGERIPVSPKDSITRVQTLFFPLEMIGDTSNAFRGYISDVRVFGKELDADRIRKIAEGEKVLP